MNISWTVKWKFIVNNMSKAFNIDTSGCNVCSNKNTSLLCTESCKNLFTLSLWNVTVKSCCFVSLFIKSLTYIVCITLALNKNKAKEIWRNVDEADKSFNLFAFTENPVLLVDEQWFFYNAFFFNDFIVTHEALCNAKDFFWNCCAEQKNAAILVCAFKNIFDVVNESHVEHFVAFIKNKIVDFGNIEDTAIHKVHYTAWCSNYDFNTLAEGTHLFAHWSTAVNNGKF